MKKQRDSIEVYDMEPHQRKAEEYTKKGYNENSKIHMENNGKDRKDWKAFVCGLCSIRETASIECSKLELTHAILLFLYTLYI